MYIMYAQIELYRANAQDQFYLYKRKGNNILQR